MQVDVRLGTTYELRRTNYELRRTTYKKYSMQKVKICLFISSVQHFLHICIILEGKYKKFDYVINSQLPL